MPTSTFIRFIDAHNHLHGLSYDAWETVGATGAVAVILSAGNPHVHRELHAEVPDLQDVLRYWDEPIRLAASVEKNHFIKAYVAIGISFMTKVNEWEKAIERMPAYLDMPEVVALGETGLDPIQYFGMLWPMDEQKIVLAEQVRLAKEKKKAFILHTPTPKSQRDYGTHGKLAYSNISAENYKRHFLDMNLEIINKVGLDHRSLVIDHADETIIDYVLKETSAYVGIGVGQSMRHTNPKFFADTIEKYGPERFMINTDYVSYVSCDLLAIPKAIRTMRRYGLEDSVIQKAVFDNANEFYRLGL